MKNRMKRWIGTLIAFCLAAGLLPGTALAEDEMGPTHEEGICFIPLDDSGNVKITSIGSDDSGSDPASGNLVIPDEVAWAGENYTVTAIGENAFRQKTGLTGVTIPGTVTAIGENAFKDCNSLATVIFEGENPPTIEGDAFGGIAGNAAFYYPVSAANAYINSTWQNNSGLAGKTFEPINLWIGGVPVPDGAYLIQDSDAAQMGPLNPEPSSYAYWNEDTLTLHNMTVPVESDSEASPELKNSCAVYYYGGDNAPFTIELQGDNTLTVRSSPSGPSAAIYVAEGGALIIRGEGSLNASANNYGIYAEGAINITGGDVTAESNSLNNNSLACGIYSDNGDVTIGSGAEVEATASNPGGDAYGICGRNITIDAGVDSVIAEAINDNPEEDFCQAMNAGNITLEAPASDDDDDYFIKTKTDGTEKAHARSSFPADWDWSATTHFEMPTDARYNVEVKATKGGTVTGGGAYRDGASVTVSAEPVKGYTFVRWTENDDEVSQIATYSFDANADRTLVAEFQPDEQLVSPGPPPVIIDPADDLMSMPETGDASLPMSLLLLTMAASLCGLGLMMKRKHSVRRNPG